MNSQNNHWLVLSLEDESILMKTKYPVHIILCGKVTFNCYIVPPFVFPRAVDSTQGGGVLVV